MFFSLFLYFSAPYLLDPSPTKYLDNSDIIVNIGSLKSSKFTFPLSADFENLFCLPQEFVQTTSLFDNIIGNFYGPSNYKYTPNTETHKCKVLCKKDYTPKQKEMLYHLIDSHYKAYLYADKVPCRVKFGNSTENEKYTYGYDIGFREGNDRKRGLDVGLHYLYTHLNITFHFYRDYSLGTNTLVSFDIVPYAPPNKPPCSYDFPGAIEDTDSFIFTYTMDHVYVDDKPDKKWEEAVKSSYAPPFDITRMVYYIIAGISFTLIFYSLFTQYIKNILSNPNGMQQHGWKSIRADVFRPPRYPISWAGFVSNGFHIQITALTFLVLGELKVLSPSSIAKCLKILLTIYVAYSIVAGFVNQYLYSATGTNGWKFSAVKIGIYSLLIPLIYFVILTIFNSLSESLEYISLNRILILVFTMIISFALNTLGLILCVTFKRFKGIGECSTFSRKMHSLPFYLVHEVTETAIGFVIYLMFLPMLDVLISYVWVPFGLWKIWGLLLGSYISVLGLSSAISVCVGFIRLCHEDHEWWWTSFKGPMMSAMFIMMHIMRVFMLNMETLNKYTSIIYIMKCFGFSMLFGMSCGAAGSISTFIFIKWIYSKKA